MWGCAVLLLSPLTCDTVSRDWMFPGYSESLHRCISQESPCNSAPWVLCSAPWSRSHTDVSGSLPPLLRLWPRKPTVRKKMRLRDTKVPFSCRMCKKLWILSRIKAGDPNVASWPLNVQREKNEGIVFQVKITGHFSKYVKEKLIGSV